METLKIKKQKGKKMRKWHKWGGLLFSFFFILFAISGIFLNHRKAISSIDIKRSLIPTEYHYKNWNNGAVKGSLKLSEDSILLFGGAGIFLTDSLATHLAPFTKGLKRGADNQLIGSIIKTRSEEVFAISTFDLYQLDRKEESWISIRSRTDTDERLSDLQVKGDSLILLSRSHLFIATPPYRSFTKTELAAPLNYKKEATLFRSMWTLHSGELFGMPGRLFVDFLGLVAIFLCLTGIVITFFPGMIKRRKKKKKTVKSLSGVLTQSFKLHNKIGVALLVFLLLLVVSGTFLRPPLLIAIVRGKVGTLPGTSLNSSNPWFDKLRCIRYDSSADEWLLYSSDGFFSFKNLKAEAQRLQSPPPVSVMGVNVLEQKDADIWLVGSFSGLYYWHKGLGKSVDAFTLQPVKPQRGGPPTFSQAISGYVDDLAIGKLAFDYSTGAKGMNPMKTFPEMSPEVLEKSRISLWHLCLEIHTGRIYAPLIGRLTDLFVFLSGLISLSILLSGYLVYKRRNKKRLKQPSV